MKELIDAYGLEVVQAYMGHIQVCNSTLQYLLTNCMLYAPQENAELAVRDMLKTIAANTLVRFIYPLGQVA